MEILKNFLRRLLFDDEPEDSAEIKAREEILQWREKLLRERMSNHRKSIIQ